MLKEGNTIYISLGGWLIFGSTSGAADFSIRNCRTARRDGSLATPYAAARSIGV